MRTTMIRILMGMSSALLLAATANAAPMIDFRDGDWNPAPGSNTHTYHDMYGMDLTINSMEADGFGNYNVAGALYHGKIDGYGIKWIAGDKDEFEFPEVLGVSFSEMAYIQGFYTSDFFIEGWAEQGSYSLDGGSSWTSFTATNSHPNGEEYISVGANANMIYFTAPGQTIPGERHEFSLLGLDAYGENQVAPQSNGGPSGAVPEPGAALLFSAGLLLVGRYNGRRS